MGTGITLLRETSRSEQLIRDVNELKKRKIEIGIFSEAGGNILMIANVNEFGVDIKVTEPMRNFFFVQFKEGKMKAPLRKDTTHIHIPERAFIRGTVRFRKKVLAKKIETHLDRLVHGEISIDQYWFALGEELTAVTREYMTNLKIPKNHPFTVENKGGKKNPLIDSGELREKITWRVV